MDNDRIKGAAKVKGAIKETAGKLTGNRQTEIEGKAEKAVGKVQRNIGEARTRPATRWTRSRENTRPAPRAVPARGAAPLARGSRQPVLFLRTDRSSPIMKHYRNAALGLALALGAALAPAHAQGNAMSQDQIDARYDAAKKQCDARSGDSKDLCLKQARADKDVAEAQAKAGKQKAEANHDAAKARQDADYDVAKKKCTAMSGDAKDACLAEAKTRYGK